MEMWKGVFSPTFVKHHGGTQEDHIMLDGNYSLDGNTLTVSFHLDTYRPNNPTYDARWELTDDEVSALDSGDVTVEELIGDQLDLPPDERTWSNPNKQ